MNRALLKKFQLADYLVCGAFVAVLIGIDVAILVITDNESQHLAVVNAHIGPLIFWGEWLLLMAFIYVMAWRWGDPAVGAILGGVAGVLTSTFWFLTDIPPGMAHLIAVIFYLCIGAGAGALFSWKARDPSKKHRMAWRCFAGVIVAALVMPVNSSVSQLTESMVPGKFGGTLEFRLMAVDADKFQRIERRLRSDATIPPGDDYFPAADSRFLENGGTAPAGWTWMPMAPRVDEFDPTKILAVSRALAGKGEALVSNNPDAILIHDPVGRHWGVRTATVSEHPAARESVAIVVDIQLDATAGRMLHDLTARYPGHYIAMVVNNQIVSASRVNTPLGEMFELPLGLVDQRTAVDVKAARMSALRLSASELRKELLAP